MNRSRNRPQAAHGASVRALLIVIARKWVPLTVVVTMACAIATSKVLIDYTNNAKPQEWSDGPISIGGDGPYADGGRGRGDEQIAGRSLQRVSKKRQNAIHNPGEAHLAVVVPLVSEPITNGYVDALAVLGQSLRSNIRRQFEPIVLCGPGSDAWSPGIFNSLRRVGWKVYSVELPLPLEDIENEQYQQSLKTSGCCGEAELVKLHAFNLTEYRRVLLLDADTMLLQPIDELLDADADAVWTFDTYLGGNCINGGFLVLTPSSVVYSGLVDIVREGNFRDDGSAWGGSNIGWCYGGQTFQGIVPYYYQKLLPRPFSSHSSKKWIAANGCIYNNFGAAECFLGDGRHSKKARLSSVKLFHFTGACGDFKPFLACKESSDAFCVHFISAWRAMRRKVERRFGIVPTEQCSNEGGDYIPLLLEDNSPTEQKLAKVENAVRNREPKIGGYLVYCPSDAANLSPLYMFEEAGQFKRHTLEDTPLPFDSAVPILLIETSNKECEATEYYQEALQRRREAEFIPSPYNLERNNRDVENLTQGIWVDRVFWPHHPDEVPYLRNALNRPLIVRILGEVFYWRAYGSCSSVDFVVYRSKEHSPKDCLTLHYTQGISHGYRLDKHDYDIHSSLLLSDNNTDLAGDIGENASVILPGEQSFCVMFTVAIKKVYEIDALVRHAFAALLSEYKPCKRPVDCKGNDLDAYKCMRNYRFAITMENTQQNGYVSEKVFLGALAGRRTVPIYFGAPDAHDYINLGRVISCNVSVSFIEEMRRLYYPYIEGKPLKERIFLFNATNPNPTDKDLVEWAKEYLRPMLHGCVERVKFLDQNLRAYHEVSRQPLVTNGDLLSGADVYRGFQSAYSHLTHPGRSFNIHSGRGERDSGGGNHIGAAIRRNKLTFDRFSGRFNNQLFQFVAALQAAVILNRTLVVPPETSMETWTGMFDNEAIPLWDMSALHDNYDIDFETARNEPLSVDERCKIDIREALASKSGGIADCPTIHIGGKGGLLFCYQQHRFCGNAAQERIAYEIYGHLRLSRQMNETLSKFNANHELAVHSRTHTATRQHPHEVCVRGNEKACRSHLDSSHHGVYCSDYQMNVDCAKWIDLPAQLRPDIASSILAGDTFVLAHDGTHDWSAEYGAQYTTISNARFLEDIALRLRTDGQRMRKLFRSPHVIRLVNDSGTLLKHIDRLSQILLEMFSMVQPSYFVGNIYSTLSLAVCMLRGEERKDDSNMCWMLMHPDEKLAIPPPNGHQQEEKMKRVGSIFHPFAWSNDSNFVAIDRYLVDQDNKIQVAVLGDGIIPLTFLGGDVIEARFTCSMGNDKEGKARVEMIRGHKGFKDHYQRAQSSSPFSANGDVFRTVIIYCSVGIDPKHAHHPSLSFSGDNFSVKISSPFVLPHPGNAPANQPQKYRLIQCVCPIYGIKTSRWIIEYLEYHRAIGISHIHLYFFDNIVGTSLPTVLEEYRVEGFVTLHVWSAEASRRYTEQSYEHGKWAAMADCQLRSRGVADFVLFTDIDEVMTGNSAGDGTLNLALNECHEAHLSSDRKKIGCSFNSHTMTSIYRKFTSENIAGEQAHRGLLLERYSYEEAKPLCPFNCKGASHCFKDPNAEGCRKFHYGRQKYFLFVGDTSIPPIVPWTHAAWRNYEWADNGMIILDDEVAHVRHYQGHWYLNENKLESVEERQAQLPSDLLNTVRSRIYNSSVLQRAYLEVPIAGLDWIDPILDHKKDSMPSNFHQIEIDRVVCSTEVAERQEERIKQRFIEWWSHSACPDQVWLKDFVEAMHVSGLIGSESSAFTIIDIGCNKGYSSAAFMNSINSFAKIGPKQLHEAIRSLSSEDGKIYDRECGVCNECKKNEVPNKVTKHLVDIHCVEPSPSTFDLLVRVKEKLGLSGKSKENNAGIMWHIHNHGMYNSSGTLAWHPSCASETGGELCTIVTDDEANAIKVGVTTVDDFRSKYLEDNSPIHILKIDAEGFDPAVLQGATETLQLQKAAMLVFEWNPGLREKRPPRGIWGPVTLMEVVVWLDKMSYDCYLDSRAGEPEGIEAPALYLLSGGCVRNDPPVRGWANVVCASRAYPAVARSLRQHASLVKDATGAVDAMSDDVKIRGSSKVIVGLILTDRDYYYDALQAQMNTWLGSVPNERIFVVGPNKTVAKHQQNVPRFIESPCPDRMVWCKRIEHIAEGGRLLKQGLDFDWLWSGNEDWYVDVEALVDALHHADRGPNDAVVYTSLGCSQWWKFHKNSNNGTLPKPIGWPQVDSCDALKERGGVCAGYGVVFSRKAIEIMTANGTESLFKRARSQPFDWDSNPQGDPVLSCVIYSFHGQIEFALYPWKAIGISNDIDVERKYQAAFDVRCPRCRVATGHIVAKPASPLLYKLYNTMKGHLSGTESKLEEQMKD